mmetsp:Transcript_6865/g.14294  ORF Transcript_6865/g.14294 Transcript_6865/m.14294 type:complete len:314 (-) Transcript_6865:27-968(-)
MIRLLTLSSISLLFQEIKSFAPIRLFHRSPVKHSSICLSPSVRQSVDWIKKESLESILPVKDAHAIISELISHESLMDDSEHLISRNLDSVEKKLRKETRSLQEVFGKDITDKLLSSVQNIDAYDSGSVKTFLGSDAINALLAKILYNGIFEFFQKIDIFGNIINSLPILGPIRQQLIKETKKSLDKSLGPLVQNFLGTYTKTAVLQASEYVLSPSNRKAFASANVKLVSSILERPVSSLIPSSEIIEKLKKDAFLYLRNADTESVDKYLTFVYKLLGDKCVDNLINVDLVLEASPTLQKTLDNIWERANKNQ